MEPFVIEFKDTLGRLLLGERAAVILWSMLKGPSGAVVSFLLPLIDSVVSRLAVGGSLLYIYSRSSLLGYPGILASSSSTSPTLLVEVMRSEETMMVVSKRRYHHLRRLF